MEFQYIRNPATGRKVNIHTKLGQDIINNYAQAGGVDWAALRAKASGAVGKAKNYARGEQTDSDGNVTTRFSRSASRASNAARRAKDFARGEQTDSEGHVTTRFSRGVSRASDAATRAKNYARGEQTDSEGRVTTRFSRGVSRASDAARRAKDYARGEQTDEEGRVTTRFSRGVSRASDAAARTRDSIKSRAGQAYSAGVELKHRKECEYVERHADSCGYVKKMTTGSEHYGGYKKNSQKQKRRYRY